MAEDSLLGGSIFQSLGEARSLDYKDAREREKNAERRHRRKARREQILYSTVLAPIGQSLAQGVTEFINQPFVSKHEDFVERESYRYANRHKKHTDLAKRLDALNNNAAGAAKSLYINSGTDAEIVRAVRKDHGSKWEDNAAAMQDYTYRSSSAMEAYQKEVDELSAAVKQGSDLQMTPAEYQAKLENTSPYSKTAVGAGLRALGRMVGIGNTKPLKEREMEALKSANPTVYNYIKGRTKEEFEQDYVAAMKVSLGDWEYSTEGEEDIPITESKARQMLRKKNMHDFNILTLNKGNEHDENFIQWAVNNKDLTPDNASTFVEGNDKYNRSLSAYNNKKDHEAWVEGGRSVTFENERKRRAEGDPAIDTSEATVSNEALEKREKLIELTMRGAFKADGGKNFHALRNEVIKYIDTGEISDTLNNHFSTYGKKMAGEVLSDDNLGLEASNVVVVDAIEAITKRKIAQTVEDDDDDDLKNASDVSLAAKLTYQKRAAETIQNSTRSLLMNYQLENPELTRKKLESLVLPAIQQVATAYNENGGDLSQFELDPDRMHADAKKYALRSAEGGTDWQDRPDASIETLRERYDWGDPKQGTRPGESTPQLGYPSIPMPNADALAFWRRPALGVGRKPQEGKSLQELTRYADRPEWLDTPVVSLLSPKKPTETTEITDDEITDNLSLDTDVPRREISEIQEIISEVSNLFGDDERANVFLNAIALNESNFARDAGTYNISKNKKGEGVGSLGIFQIDKVAFEEVMSRLVGSKPAPRSLWQHKEKITDFVQKYSGTPLEDITYENLKDDRINTLFARLYLMTKKEPLPSSKNMGDYWKKFYNTSAGKGDANKFMDRWDTFNLPTNSLSNRSD